MPLDETAMVALVWARHWTSVPVGTPVMSSWIRTWRREFRKRIPRLTVLRWISSGHGIHISEGVLEGERKEARLRRCNSVGFKIDKNGALTSCKPGSNQA